MYEELLMTWASTHCIRLIEKSNFKNVYGDFPGGTVVKNPPAKAGDMRSIPGPGRSHMPWNN